MLSSCAVRSNESTVTARGASEAVNVLLTACNTAWDSSRSQSCVTPQAAWLFEGTHMSVPTLWLENHSSQRTHQQQECLGPQTEWQHRLFTACVLTNPWFTYASKCCHHQFWEFSSNDIKNYINYYIVLHFKLASNCKWYVSDYLSQRWTYQNHICVQSN